MDATRVGRLLAELIQEVGEDPSREGLLGTPERLALILARFSIPKDIHPIHFGAGVSGTHRMTVVRGLPFYSLCEHHLLPFFGSIDIGLVPSTRSCDPADLAEVIDSFAHRLQIQERMTEQIADALNDMLVPEGLGVACQGRHLCLMMRGVGKQSSEIQTSTLRGCFLEPVIRRSFLAHLRRRIPAER